MGQIKNSRAVVDGHCVLSLRGKRLEMKGGAQSPRSDESQGC